MALDEDEQTEEDEEEQGGIVATRPEMGAFKEGLVDSSG